MLKNILIVATAIVIFCNSAHSESKLPKGIKCLFSMEPYPEGKSNQASCGMMPEEIFSTRNYRKKRNQHCKVEGTHSVSEFKNFHIDFERYIVSYDDVYYLSEHGKKSQKAYYIREGLSEEVAERKVERKSKTLYEESIDKVFFQNDAEYFDPITKEFLKRPINTRIYNVVFGKHIFQMKELVPEAIISDFESVGQNSWLSMRFGKCKILK